MPRTIRARIAALAAPAIVLALAGCGYQDAEFNGKIFDALGVSSKSQVSTKEPKMVARAPLVLPPGVDRLPVPGKQPGSEAANIAGINAIVDPDEKAKVDMAQLEREHAAYCKKHYHEAKAHGDNEADSAVGPLGSCRTSFLSVLQGIGAAADEPDGDEGQIEKQ